MSSELPMKHAGGRCPATWVMWGDDRPACSIGAMPVLPDDSEPEEECDASIEKAARVKW